MDNLYAVCCWEESGAKMILAFSFQKDDCEAELRKIANNFKKHGNDFPAKDYWIETITLFNEGIFWEAYGNEENDLF